MKLVNWSNFPLIVWVKVRLTRSSCLSEQLIDRFFCLSKYLTGDVAAIQRVKRHAANFERQRTCKGMLAHRRSPNTCTWFFEHHGYCKWSSRSHADVLWIQGKPGSGKSVLCATLVDYLTANKVFKRAKILSFFRSWDETTDPAIDFLSTLISYLQETPQHLLLDFTLQSVLVDIEMLTSAMSCTQFKQHLQTILTNLESMSKLVLVLDGWDEWLANTVLHQLIQANTFRQHEYKILCAITSRGPLPLEYAQNNVVIVDAGETPGLQNDIHRFVNVELSSIGHNMTRPSLISSLTEQICSRAAGTFLWANLAVEHIKQSSTNAQERKEIRTLPADLWNIYSFIISSIAPEESARVLATFSWVLAARRPLTHSELLSALAISEISLDNTQTNTPDVISPCGGLVVMAPDSSIRFVHTSFREYLSQSEGKGFVRDAVTRCHEMVARACLKYLAFDNSCCLLSFGDVHQTVVRDDNTPALREYVVSNWCFHYRIAEPHSRALAGTLQSHLYREFTRNHAENLQAPHSLGLAHATLEIAITHGLDSLAQILIESGIGSDDVCCKQCLTPLALAIAAGRHSVIALLLHNGASPNATSCSGKTPLQFAIENADFDIVQTLISHGADTNAGACPPAVSPLAAAVSSGNVGIVKLLLEGRPEYVPRFGTQSAIPDNGKTLLHLAAESGSLSVMALLVDGGDVDTSTLAVYEGVTQQSFFQSWSEDMLQEISGEMRWICEFQKHQAAGRDIKLSMSRSAAFYGLDVQDHQGLTPLHLAATYGHEEVVKFLILRGATHDIRDHHGRNALQHAAESGHMSTVKHLLVMGAPKYPKGESMGSLLERVYNYGHEKVANMLLMDSYVTDVTGEGCGWQMLGLIANSERSPVRDAIGRKSRRDNKMRRSGRTKLPPSSKNA